MSLGAKIQRLRKRRGMSQEKLAEELGVSRQAVSKWELDAALPDIGNIVALSRLFGVTADYLIKDEQEEDEPTAEKHGRRKYGRKKLIGMLCVVTGAVSIFFTYVISRFVPVMTPIRVYSDGKWYNHWNSSHVEVDYIYFIKEYKLQLLLALFSVLILAGIVLMLWDRWLKDIVKKIIAAVRQGYC